LVLEKIRVWGRRERISIRKIELFNSIKPLAVVVGSKFLNNPGSHLFFKLPAGIIVHCTSLQQAETQYASLASISFSK